MPHLERYWSAADPDYCDGEGAESFRALLGRCEAALARLAAMPPASLVYVFGHGQFIQAARTIVADADLAGAQVAAACFVVDLPALGGSERLRAKDVPVETLLSFAGH